MKYFVSSFISHYLSPIISLVNLHMLILALLLLPPKSMQNVEYCLEQFDRPQYAALRLLLMPFLERTHDPNRPRRYEKG